MRLGIRTFGQAVRGVNRLAFVVTTIAFAVITLAPSGTAQPLFPPLAGANDTACVTGPDRVPVVLVHGSGTDVTRSFGVLAPALHADGHCVFAANVGQGPALVDAVSGHAGSSIGIGPVGAALSGRPVWGVASIENMAGELAAVVRTVRERTGVARIALVGHSTGGTVIRQYLREHGGADIATVVTLGTPYRGSTWDGLREMFPDLAALGLTDAQIATQTFGAPGAQQTVGSPLLSRLGAGGETVPGIRYTAIASRADAVITPASTALLERPDADDRNVWLQDGCPADIADHSAMLADARAITVVRNALDGGDRPLPC
ncbi:esterase/lipase family protein [Nocardia cyriacigeorgica]|uniref:esterase/lipase family protein n=1 Tax=Nocardia cyriacigeorgica TaxID=135487 RepID=UPI0024539D38|nr:alpha/beta fold hydrolase [Nocardia cyriacigeorgica]